MQLLALAMAALSLILAIAVPVGGGFLTGYFSSAGQSKDMTWYRSIKKPSWNPPSWLFGPVWTALYVSMGLASWLIWRMPPSNARVVALSLYVTQLALNFTWTPLFFAAHNIRAALGILSALVVALTACVVAFWNVRPVAGILMLPYLAWALFASSLNAAIVALNPHA